MSLSVGKGVASRRPRSLGGERVIVAIDDAAYDDVVGALRDVWGEIWNMAVDFVRASELTDPANDADVWFGKYTPSAPGRQLLWVTETLERYEQDPGSGLLYMNGSLVWPMPPVAYGDPRTREEGKLRLFHECAVVFSPSEGVGARVRIRTMGRLIQLAREPRTVLGWKPPDWLVKAYSAMSPFGPDLAERLGATRADRSESLKATARAAR